MILYSNQIVSPMGVIAGYIHVEDGKISAITKTCDASYLDYSDLMIMPGFLDIHVHGWGRGSYAIENTPESIVRMGEDMAKEGVVGFLATTLTASIQDTLSYIETANEVYGTHIDGAAMLGVHLEGPFINKEYKGMQDEASCIDPDVALMKTFYDAQNDPSMIKLMTLAPELRGAKEVITFNRDHNIQNSIGHSGATFETIATLKHLGLGGVTHMYSGMRGLHHRELGVVGSALYFDDLYCEFAKQTGITVRHEAFDLALRAKGAQRIIMTTDCFGVSRLTKPTYSYTRKITWSLEGDFMVATHDNGEIRRFDRNDYQAISKMEMGYAASIKNMMRHTPVSLYDLSLMTSFNPAQYIGIQTKGQILVGYDADFTVLNKDFDVYDTIVGGKSILKKDTTWEVTPHSGRQ